MLSLWLGIAAFVLFFIYDINSVKWKNEVIHRFFAAGAVLLVLSSATDILKAVKAGAFKGFFDVLLIVFSAVSLAALIYSLFFALPFDETYVKNSEERKVYDRGVYALCRHPGIICYFLMQLFLGLAALPEKLIINGMILSLMNLLYAWFQDRITFPKTFTDYTVYRNNVPFLLPTLKSIKRAKETFGKAQSREEVQ